MKQKLRLQAAINQRSMEAEAREILTRAMEKPLSKETSMTRRKKLQSIAGIWKGKGSTNELMKMTRGEG